MEPYLFVLYNHLNINRSPFKTKSIKSQHLIYYRNKLKCNFFGFEISKCMKTMKVEFNISGDTYIFSTTNTIKSYTCNQFSCLCWLVSKIIGFSNLDIEQKLLKCHFTAPKSQNLCNLLIGKSLLRKIQVQVVLQNI